MEQRVKEEVEAETTKLKAKISRLDEAYKAAKQEKEAAEVRYMGLANRSYDPPSSSPRSPTPSETNYKEKWEEERDFRRELQEDYNQLQAEAEENATCASELRKELAQSDSDRKEMAGQLARKKQQLQDVRDELRDTQKDLAAANKTKKEASRKADHLEKENRRLQDEIEKCKAEKDEYKKKVSDAIQSRSKIKSELQRYQELARQNESDREEALRQLEQCRTAVKAAESRTRELEEAEDTVKSRESEWRFVQSRLVDVRTLDDDDWNETHRLIVDGGNVLERSAPAPAAPQPWEPWPFSGEPAPTLPTIEAVCVAIRSETSLKGRICFLLHQLNRMLAQAPSANVSLVETSLCRAWERFDYDADPYLADAALMCTAQAMELARLFGPVEQLEDLVGGLLKRDGTGWLQKLHVAMTLDKVEDHYRTYGMFCEGIKYGLMAPVNRPDDATVVDATRRRMHHFIFGGNFEVEITTSDEPRVIGVCTAKMADNNDLKFIFSMAELEQLRVNLDTWYDSVHGEGAAELVNARSIAAANASEQD